MDDVKTKQQIADKIKKSTNILVTVSNNPTVDALTAALGLTLLLDKLDKHATAVFSGAVPPAISFLEPEKTFENTPSSLQDFIIALDKEKADHLRYKVEGDVVKIFITPYKTTITSDDLAFSQGDYNVELVLALGVDNKDHLDSALDAHGRILHDATVATITAGDLTSELGSINWHESKASGLSEMLVNLSDTLKGEKALLDSQTATAFLTGIVAQTDRFSNPLTTSTVMTTAAQLMAAGADQQLIAARLQESHTINAPDASADDTPQPEPQNDSPDSETPPEAPKSGEGGLSITHEDEAAQTVAPAYAPEVQEPPVDEPNETLEEIAHRVKVEEQSEAAEVAQEALKEQESAEPEVEEPALPAEEPTAFTDEPMIVNDDLHHSSAVSALSGSEPLLGGTLNATTEEAAEAARQELESDQNKTILTHAYLDASPSYSAPLNGVAQEAASEKPVDIFANSSLGGALPPIDPLNPLAPYLDTPSAPQTFPSAPIFPPQPPVAPALNLPMPPELPPTNPFSPPESPSIASAYALESADPGQPGRLGDIFAPEPSSPTLPVTPPHEAYAPPIESSPLDMPPPANPNDPGQFKIPGQS